jgi:hypothetical protein
MTLTEISDLECRSGRHWAGKLERLTGGVYTLNAVDHLVETGNARGSQPDFNHPAAATPTDTSGDGMLDGRSGYGLPVTVQGDSLLQAGRRLRAPDTGLATNQAMISMDCDENVTVGGESLNLSDTRAAST